MNYCRFLSFIFLLLPSMAFAKWSFCAGQTQFQGVHCSNVAFTFSAYWANKKCQNWASNENIPLINSYTFFNKDAALSKQREICDSIPDKGKWQCFVIEDCGDTSSISPIDTRVFAISGDTEFARDECVRVGWQAYRQALINANHGCKIAPDAVQLMF